MNALFLKLLNMSAAGSILIIAVVALRTFLKKAPRWIICAMWTLVAIRLVCPVSIASPLSAFRAMPSLISEDGEVAVFRPAGGVEKPLLTVDTVQIERPQTSSDTIQRIPGTSLVVTQRSRDTYLPPLVQAYLLGFFAMLLYAVISTFLLWKRVSVSIPLRGNIRICDEISSPFILGIVRPNIYLPSNLGDEEQHFVLSHELAHLHRLDYIWKPLGFLILGIYWFNPLCWLAYVMFCQDIELACDEKVIRQMGRTERAAYTQTLLNCSAQRVLTACPVAFGEINVKTRVKAVLDYRRPSFWISFVAVLGCVVLVLLLMTKPTGNARDDPMAPGSDNSSPNLVSADTEPSGSLDTTDPFGVEDYLPEYQEVLDSYRLALTEELDPTLYSELRVSSMVRNYYGQNPLQKLGYSLTDLNDDGIPELIIGSVENEDFYGEILFDVYRLFPALGHWGPPVKTVESMERIRWYVLGSGLLLNESSGGASNQKWSVWRIDRNETAPVFVEGLVLDASQTNDLQDSSTIWFTARLENGEVVKDKPLTEQDAMDWQNTYFSRKSRLSFTPFSEIQ